MSNNDHLKDLLNAIGVLAETSLLFYRAVIQTGASEEEAKFLTQALIRASMTSNPTQESERDCPSCDGTGPGKYGVDTDHLCARAKAYCESGRSEFGDRKRPESEAQ